MYYDFNYAGTAPLKQRFSLRGNDYTSLVIHIRYTQARAYIVKDYLGNIIPANGWDSAI